MMTTYILIAAFICIIGILDYRTRRLQSQQKTQEVKIKDIYGCLDAIQEVMSEQNKVNSKNLDTIKAVLGQFNNNQNIVKKLFLAVYVLRMGAQEAVCKTVSKVLSDPKIQTLRETGIILLNNLLVEYHAVSNHLKEQLKLLEDIKEKENIEKMITEYENIISLISTVSDESSDEYLEQIFVEVVSSMKKVRNIGN